MPYQIGIGVPMPMLTPITATWTAPFAAYLVFLSNRVVYHRIQNERFMGDRISATNSPENDDLYIATRSHANFLENVPLAFAFAAIAEVNGANRKWLNVAMAAFFAVRVAHVELGLTKSFQGKKTIGPGRIAGFYGSQAFLLGLAGYSAYLVKGYWGF
ncbi:hypothetical protein K490DRAFT_44723 [Saccharata proteae CBS 121410]|uniref:Membrane-associated proteins in eicosanoid and glutathione metabolism n=1 Tax=Saccharata proteae CBS 121410 TaxID=1314787 RepID=A0A9P4LYU4_9PEZI|nr:hypothetical protein K490DRAFT_44723 [Saccharata proteae CBS 121410]